MMIQDLAISAFSFAAGVSGLAVGSSSLVTYLSYLNLLVGSCVLLYSLYKVLGQRKANFI
jgi:hypothetical protein